MMARLSRALTTLTLWELRSGPSNYMALQFWGSNALFWPFQAPGMHAVHLHMEAEHTNMPKIVHNTCNHRWQGLLLPYVYWTAYSHCLYNTHTTFHLKRQCWTMSLPCLTLFKQDGLELMAICMIGLRHPTQLTPLFSNSLWKLRGYKSFFNHPVCCLSLSR